MSRLFVCLKPCVTRLSSQRFNLVKLWLTLCLLCNATTVYAAVKFTHTTPVYGNFKLSWSGARQHVYVERVGAGNLVWKGPTGGSTNVSISTPGSYTFRLKDCFYMRGSESCTVAKTIKIDITAASLAPPVPNTPSAPSTDNDGLFKVSWSSVSGAQTYKVSRNGSLVQHNGNLYRNTQSLADGTYSYKISACKGSYCSGWSGARSVKVIRPAQVTSLSAKSNSIKMGQTTNITWNSSRASSCSASVTNGVGSIKAISATSGTTTYTAPAATTSTKTATIKVVCNGEGGNHSKTVSVSVAPILPTVTVSFSPTTIDTGETSTLRWSSTNATGCTRSNISSSQGSLGSVSAKSGSLTYTAPAANAISSDQISVPVTITCTGPGGSANKKATIVVLRKPIFTSSTPQYGYFTLSWNHARGRDVDIYQGSNRIFGKNAVAGSHKIHTSTAKSSTYTLKDCLPETRQCVSESLSVNVTAAMLTPKKPSAPTLPQVSHTGSYQVKWAEATGATSYKLYRNGSLISTKTASSGFEFSETGRADATYTYAIEACNGSACIRSANSSSIKVVRPAQVTSLSVQSSSINMGQTTRVTWDSTRASSCSASVTNGVGSIQAISAVSGTTTYTAPSATTTSKTATIKVQCNGEGGNHSDTITVTVEPIAPTITASFNPSILDSGQSSTLTWSATDAKACSVSALASGQGTLTAVSEVAGSATYTAPSSAQMSSAQLNFSIELSCQGDGGETTRSLDLTVNKQAIFKATHLSASQTTLNWSSLRAYVKIEKVGAGFIPLSQSALPGGLSSQGLASGSQEINFTRTDTGSHTYRLHDCIDLNGSASGGESCNVVKTLSFEVLFPPLVSAHFAQASEAQTSEFTWSSQDADSCSLGALQGGGSLSGVPNNQAPLSGQLNYQAPNSMSANQTISLAVTCTNVKGSVTQTATTEVQWLNDAPSLSLSSPLKININTQGQASLSLSDEETPAGALSLTAHSNNTGLIDAQGIAFSGSGNTRTLTLSPNTNVFGRALITVLLEDAQGKSHQQTLSLEVEPNLAMTITSVSPAVASGGDFDLSWQTRTDGAVGENLVFSVMRDGQLVYSGAQTEVPQFNMASGRYRYSVVACYRATGICTNTLDQEVWVDTPPEPLGITVPRSVAWGGANALDVSWEKDPLDAGAQFILQRQKRGQSAWSTLVTTAATQYEDTQIEKAVYRYRVKAIDSRGHESLWVTSRSVAVIEPVADRSVIFLHTDLLGSPAAESNAQGEAK